MSRTEKTVEISAEMTILDIVGRYRNTEAVFRAWDERAGVCLCCQALFDPLDEVAARYGLDLEAMLTGLKAAAGQG
jgi:hypothetical protein